MRAFTVLLLVLVLPALWAGPAAAQDFEPPRVVPSVDIGTGSQPGLITVKWEHSAPACPGLGCVWDYSVERLNPYWRWDNVDSRQRSLLDGGGLGALQPNTEYRYRVCAYFITEDGDTECSEGVGRTAPPDPPKPPAQPKPQPRIVEHHEGETWIGIKWEAGYDYDFYNIAVGGQFGDGKGLRTMFHEDDGTWGYQRVDGLLPGRVYTFSVAGCTTPFLFFGKDRCYEASPLYSASTRGYSLHSGPDTCAPPFVWREAFAGDHVCVEADRRKQVAADNAQAPKRREYCTPPNCTFTAPVTCKVPYVWREARPGDQVCVTTKERSQVATENALANERRAVPR